MNEYIFDAGPLITSCKFSVAGRLVLDHMMAPYGLGQGESDSILLTRLIGFQNATVVIDDHLA